MKIRNQNSLSMSATSSLSCIRKFTDFTKISVSKVLKINFLSLPWNLEANKRDSRSSIKTNLRRLTWKDFYLGESPRKFPNWKVCKYQNHFWKLQALLLFWNWGNDNFWAASNDDSPEVVVQGPVTAFLTQLKKKFALPLVL